MKVFYQTPLLSLYHGDNKDLATLPYQVQCVVTSPPYFNQRDYDGNAWFGAEKTVAEYVQHTVDFFCGSLLPVLRNDGVVFWNVGDKFGVTRAKDLELIPHRIAIALADEGWIPRADIIWVKPNSMPSSAPDRPTIDYEHILMFVLNEDYFFDMEAVRVPYKESTRMRNEYGDGNMKLKGQGEHGMRQVEPGDRCANSGRNIRAIWEIPTVSYSANMCLTCKTIYGRDEFTKGTVLKEDGRWCRKCGTNNWLSHFAAFPEEIPRLCISMATSAKGQCSKCGKPWQREITIIDHQITEEMKRAGCNSDGEYFGSDMKDYEGTGAVTPSRLKQRILEQMSQVTKSSWVPQCDCNAPIEPQIVLDPFAGTGTTGKVATQLGRRSILVEQSENYCELIKHRVTVTPGLSLD